MIKYWNVSSIGTKFCMCFHASDSVKPRAQAKKPKVMGWFHGGEMWVCFHTKTEVSVSRVDGACRRWGGEGGNWRWMSNWLQIATLSLRRNKEGKMGGFTENRKGAES